MMLTFVLVTLVVFLGFSDQASASQAKDIK